jgi:capsular polysaccharide biosynthesis protein
MEMSVRNTNAQKAYDIANAIVEAAPDEIAKAVKNGTIKLVSPVAINYNPVSPNKSLDIAMSALGGAVVSITVAFIIEALNNKFKSDQDVAKVLGFQLLGVIPKVTSKEKER